ncbi:MAG: PTS sugar transporter subunit IIA [Candidatus Aminicenantales bacterium]
MNISGLLREECIVLSLEPGDKKNVLKEIISTLRERGIIKDEKLILRELLKREDVCSTGLEHGIAVPHALVEEVKEPFLALALLRRGMNFESADSQPTHVVLILLGNKKQPGIQLKILAHICRLVKETDFVGKVKKAKSAPEVCSILRKEEEKV